MEGVPKERVENTQEQGVPVLLEVVKRMESIDDSLPKEEFAKQSRELIKELLEHLSSDINLEMSADVTRLYQEMQKENLLARVEAASRVIECLAADKPIEVGSSDMHYANSVSADPEGLRIAMAEADAVGPVRLMVGLNLKSMIGFTSDHLEVSEIDDNDFDLRDTNLRKTLCRHVSGEIRREDIKYIVMRIPRGSFPQESMSEEEVRSAGHFIFRGAKVPKETSNGEGR